MALTVTEANAVNVLLKWLFAQPDNVGEYKTGEQARDAAALLADHADKTLMAGLDGDAVRKLWAVICAPALPGVIARTHALPADLSAGVTPCCRRGVLELPPRDRLVRDQHAVTCGGGDG